MQKLSQTQIVHDLMHGALGVATNPDESTPGDGTGTRETAAIGLLIAVGIASEGFDFFTTPAEALRYGAGLTAAHVLACEAFKDG